MKSAKNIVRDILRAQGDGKSEPAPEAVKIMQEALDLTWSAGYRDAEYDRNFGG